MVSFFEYPPHSAISFSLLIDSPGVASKRPFFGSHCVRTRSYRFEWRGEFDNVRLNQLHAEAFGHDLDEHDWVSQVRNHSLGWVCAFDDETLVGFVNVPWDGALHAFIVDTMVAPAVQRHGVGTELIRVAAAQARAAGCIWLHVDFEDALKRFYFDACGFVPTNAGLLSLRR